MKNYKITHEIAIGTFQKMKKMRILEIRTNEHWEMLKFEEYRKKTMTGIITKDRNDSCPESKDESNYEIEIVFDKF